MVPGQIFLLPQYQLIQKMGLLNTIPALFLPNLFSAFGTFLLRQFFMSMPQELEDAAIVDGCNLFQIFGRIMVVNPARYRSADHLHLQVRMERLHVASDRQQLHG